MCLFGFFFFFFFVGGGLLLGGVCFGRFARRVFFPSFVQRLQATYWKQRYNSNFQWLAALLEKRFVCACVSLILCFSLSLDKL